MRNCFKISSGIEVAFWLIFIFYIPSLIIIISLLPSTLMSFIFGESFDKFPRLISQMCLGFEKFRDAYGSVIIPLITGYSIQVSPESRDIPKNIQKFILFLLFLLLLSTLSNGIVHANIDRLKKDEISSQNQKITLYNILERTTSNYVKDNLSYIALTIGISLKSKS